MGTDIRPEVSKKRKYWISKHRYYELKHFCLQYPSWKKEYENLEESGLSSSRIEYVPSGNLPVDPTGNQAAAKADCLENIRLIEKVAMETDECLYRYILRAVTEGLSYSYLKVNLGIPCERDMYYDRYRKFFWILSNSRK